MTEPTEKVLRKTLEVIERPYLIVQPHFQKRKQRRQSPVLKKCEGLMEILWKDGYRSQITWHQLRDYIVELIGGFRTTVTDYLGKRATYYRKRGLSGVLKSPAKRGYLERFGFIEKISPKLVMLHHERVNRSYHFEQKSIVSFSLSNSADYNQRTIGAMVNTKTTLLLHTKREREIKSLHKQRKKPTFTPLEKAILRISQEGEGC